MHWVYYFGRVLTRIALLFTRWQVLGKENIPSQGPLLIVSNHINLADPPVLGTSIRRKTIFMAKEDLFRPKFIRYFVQNFGAFPVRRGQLDRKAFRQAKRLLAQGWALVMFPEGGRSENAQLQSALSGSALIAVRSGVPILPIGITGTESVKGIGWLLRHPKITINIGYPFSLPQADGKLTKAELAEFTDSIMEHIAELLPEEYRGIYAGKKSQPL